MVVGGADPRRRPLRPLGYAALAAFAAASICMAYAPDEEEILEDMREKMVKHWNSPRRPPSGKEVRAMTKMMRRLDRRMKKFMEMQNKEKEKFWSFLEDIIKKGQTLLSAGNLLIDVYAFVAATVASSIILIEKLGDHVQYFVCPYSGYSDVVDIFLFTVNPKGETHQGKGAGGSTTHLRINNVSFFAGLEAMGITLRQMDLQCLSLIDIKIGIMPELEGATVENKWENSSWGKKPSPTKATFIITLEEADVKIKWENFSWDKRLILEKGSSWGEKMITQERRA